MTSSEQGVLQLPCIHGLYELYSFETVFIKTQSCVVTVLLDGTVLKLCVLKSSHVLFSHVRPSYSTVLFRVYKRYFLVLGALVLKYSKATDMWTACETSVYVGELLQVAVKGGQRQAFRIQYLHQEQLLGR